MKSENEKLRQLLRDVHVFLTNSPYKISGTAALLYSIDAALFQQDESFTTQDEREAFEAKFPTPEHCMKCGDTYAATEFNAWGAHKYINLREGWMAALKWYASRPAQAEQEPEDQIPVTMKLPCELKLPGGMTVGKGCQLSTLLQAMRDRENGPQWRQRFGQPQPFDPALLNLISDAATPIAQTAPHESAHLAQLLGQTQGGAPSIVCWACKARVSLDDRADADGSCPHCLVELDLEEYLRAELTRPSLTAPQPE